MGAAEDLLASRAERTARRLMSPRYLKLTNLEAYVSGNPYEGRPHFLTMGLPLLERAPHVVDPIVAKAIRSHGDMILGEKTWPTITSDEDEGEAEGELSKDESETLDGLIGEIVEHAKLKPLMREGLEEAMSVGTAVFLAYVVDGRLTGETLKAQWCTATRDTRHRITALEISYPFVEDYFDSQRMRWMKRCMIYRRTIDEQTDTTYVPAEAPRRGQPIVWREQTVSQHGLGFCPVVWYRFLPSGAQHVDGRTLHENLRSAIDAYNRCLSQRDRSTLYCGEPERWESGVDARSRGPMGRPAEPHPPHVIEAGGQVLNPATMVRADGTTDIGRASVRKKGPGTVLSSENPDAKFGLLTLPGDGLKAMSDHITDLGAKIRSALAHVEIDVDGNSAKVIQQLSGKALELLHKTQTNFDDRVREDFGDNALLAVVDLMLRICLVVSRRSPGGIYLDSLDAALPILSAMEQEVEGAGLRWFGAHLELKWPPYFPQGAQDNLSTVQVIAQLLELKLITRAMALEMIRAERIVEFSKTPEEVLAEIDEESAKRAKEALANAPPPPPGKPQIQPPQPPQQQETNV